MLRQNKFGDFNIKSMEKYQLGLNLFWRVLDEANVL